MHGSYLLDVPDRVAPPGQVIPVVPSCVLFCFSRPGTTSRTRTPGPFQSCVPDRVPHPGRTHPVRSKPFFSS
ncbi:hypothetical protein Bca4012_010319 [Brassica carinata]